jgi:very-short-patch-repair endonuclease
MPAFVIASDRSLQSIAAIQPNSLPELTSCYGFGKLKAEQWGDPILDVVREWRKGRSKPSDNEGASDPKGEPAGGSTLEERLAHLADYLEDNRAGFRLDEVMRHDLFIHNPATIPGLLKVRNIGPKRALDHGEKLLSALHGSPFIFSAEERAWLERLEALYAEYPRQVEPEGEPLTPGPAPEGSGEASLAVGVAPGEGGEESLVARLTPPPDLGRPQGLRDLRASSSREVRQRAQELRDQQTPAEAALWEKLRARRLANLKFRRQHALGPYIVDFYCVEMRLAVEVDGQVHESADATERDIQRDAWLANHGVILVRVTNDEVETQLDLVLDRIRTASSAARHSPLHHDA